MSIIPILESELQKDIKYPNRHKTIHKFCCKNCPANINKKNGIIDPESADIQKLNKELIAKEFLYVCAWRPSRLCKGYCDNMGIDQEFLDKLFAIKTLKTNG